jgi:hypothetical protein
MSKGELKPVPLVEAISQLRDDLLDAVRAKPKEGVVFEVGTIDLELQVMAQTDVAGKLTGGWSLLAWSVGAEAELATSRAMTHTVKLSLKPYEVTEDGSRRKAEVNATTSEDR